MNGNDGIIFILNGFLNYVDELVNWFRYDFGGILLLFIVGILIWLRWIFVLEDVGLLKEVIDFVIMWSNFIVDG